MDDDGKRINLEKCKKAKKETERLGYHLSEDGIKPLDEEMQAITTSVQPQSMKDFMFFMVAKNQMNKFIPNPGNIGAPLRQLIKRDNEWRWKKRT